MTDTKLNLWFLTSLLPFLGDLDTFFNVNLHNVSFFSVMINIFFLEFHFPSFLKSDKKITRTDIKKKYACPRMFFIV